jgi:2-C-methyl-D-erythritol 4-phosphate cytidylyltransferase
VHVSAIIAAGGRGQRFGSARPKQLELLGGEPSHRRSVEAFARCAVVSDIVVALPAGMLADPPAYLRSGDKPILIVAGGDRRRDSVAEGFARVAGRAEVVVVHDAARPLVTGALIERTVAAAAASGAAIAALRAQDTI